MGWVEPRGPGCGRPDGKLRPDPVAQPILRGRGPQCPAACDAPCPHTYMEAKKKSHTTSTKCQYQAANSNPRCCLGVNCPARARIRHTINKIDQIMTCEQRKPYAMKQSRL